MKIDWNKKYTTIAVYAILVFLACYLIYKITNDWNSTYKIILTFLNTLLPFIFALAIAYFVNPLLIKIETHLLHKIDNKRLRRGIGILISYIIVLGFIIIMLSIIIPQIIYSLNELKGIPNQIIDLVNDTLEKGYLTLWNGKINLDVSILKEYLSDNFIETFSSVPTLVSSYIPVLINSLTSITSGFLSILLGFIIAVYVLAKKEDSLKASHKLIVSILPSKQAVNFINLLKESNYIFLNFVLGKLLDSLIIGIICFVGLSIFKFPFAVLLSVIVGITNIIPYFGPFIGGGIGFFIILAISPTQSLWFALFILVLQQFDGNILGPKILGDSTGLSPFWVMFAIIVFGKYFGFIGMFLGVPVLAIFKNIVDRHINRLHQAKFTTIK